MYSYAWGARIRMFKGYRSKSFPPDRLSPLPKRWFFHFVTQPTQKERVKKEYVMYILNNYLLTHHIL